MFCLSEMPGRMHEVLLGTNWPVHYRLHFWRWFSFSPSYVNLVGRWNDETICATLAGFSVYLHCMPKWLSLCCSIIWQGCYSHTLWTCCVLFVGGGGRLSTRFLGYSLDLLDLKKMFSHLIKLEFYCWWKKSQTTTWDIWNIVKPCKYGSNYLAPGAGFFPSTVCQYVVWFCFQSII